MLLQLKYTAMVMITLCALAIWFMMTDEGDGDQGLILIVLLK